MASLIPLKKALLNLCYKNLSIIAVRGHTLKKVKRGKPFLVPKVNAFKSMADSLAAKSFLRNIRGYDPPANTEQKMKDICNSVFGSWNYSDKLDSDIRKKSNYLICCHEEFDYKIPSSLLHTIKTIEDVFTFYQTPISTVTPYDALKKEDLPENLHILYDYHRFHPETDTMFNGISAFPRSSTIVTGIKYRKKYKGHVAGNPWTDL